MAVLSLTPLLPGPYTVTVWRETGLGWMRSCFIAGGTVIAYVEAEGIDASGARVAESDIKRRRDQAMGHLL